MPSRDAITLPDVLTTHDNLEIEMPPLPDATFLLSQMDDDGPTLGRKRRAGSLSLQDDYRTSNYFQSSVEKNGFLDDDDLGLEDDLGLGSILDYGENIVDEPSIEIGRDAPAARPVEEDVFGESDINMLGKDDTIVGREREQSVRVSIAGDDGFHFDDDGDIAMGVGDDTFAIGDQPDASALIRPGVLERARISESPLSDIDPEVEAEVEAEHQRLQEASMFAPDESEHSIQQAPQRQRRVKMLSLDAETVFSRAQIREQQNDRSNILQEQTFLPRDSNLLALMEMQKNGSFVSNIMGAGREQAWAPELRGMLSLDVIRASRDLKRKRDSGVADLDEPEGTNKSPRLEIEEEEEQVIARAGLGGDETGLAPEASIVDLPADETARQLEFEDDEGIAGGNDTFAAGSPGPNFDDTTAPLVHPQDSGPVSLGTKHAVHLLRDQFGSEAETSAAQRRAASVVFQDLLPEATTSKADATKMFFEVLVLATKDAVKVEQPEGNLGGPIRIRGKRGLWGSWAEREAGGEIAEEATAPVPAPVAVEA